MSISVDYNVVPIGDQFVAEVVNIDVKDIVDEGEQKKIVDLLDQYVVLVFRNQDLDDEYLTKLARAFGPLDDDLYDVQKTYQSRLKNPAVSDISNVGISGDVAERTHPQTIMNLQNSMWHSDASFKRHPFRYSMLYALTAVSWGGETEFADLRAAYDALDDRTKKFIEGRTSEFFAYQSYGYLGLTPSEEKLAAFPPVRWPLVRTHPSTGRKILWVGTPLREISGISQPEGRALGMELLEHATRRERVYSHSWQPRDLVIWDNRACLHRGRRFDLAERREMRRVSCKDDVASLD